MLWWPPYLLVASAFNVFIILFALFVIPLICGCHVNLESNVNPKYLFDFTTGIFVNLGGMSTLPVPKVMIFDLLSDKMRFLFFKPFCQLNNEIFKFREILVVFLLWNHYD